MLLAPRSGGATMEPLSVFVTANFARPRCKRFQGTKYESFARKLNRWGFKRASNAGLEQGVFKYKCDLFHRDRLRLMRQMNGAGTKRRKPPNVVNLPEPAASAETQEFLPINLAALP